MTRIHKFEIAAYNHYNDYYRWNFQWILKEINFNLAIVDDDVYRAFFY